MRLKPILIMGTVVLVASLMVNLYFYNKLFTSNPLSLRREQTANLQSQLLTLQTQANNLQNEESQLKAQMNLLAIQLEPLQNRSSSLLTENFSLKSKKSHLEYQLHQLLSARRGDPVKLVTKIGARDLRYNYSGQDIRLYLSGEVWNVGAIATRNCRLHITLYQGDVVANDTYIQLGAIDAGSYVAVASDIYYSGPALTDWRIIPESD